MEMELTSVTCLLVNKTILLSNQHTNSRSSISWYSCLSTFRRLIVGEDV